MGASHTTLASTSAGGEEGILPELDGGSPGNNASNTQQTNATKHDLSAYALDEPLFPGSGRMMRTFRLRHKQNGSKVILKTMYVSKEHESLVNDQESELKRILEALSGQPHVAPFLYWSIGPYRQKPLANNVPTMTRQVSLLRTHMYTTLSDRIASRPFLTHVEKLWISYQLLQALEAMHSKGVVHGFLTAENIGLTSWNWVVLLDVASYKARTALPDDDPTEYLYYFQENYSHPYAQGKDTTRREKKCYLAPERFFTPSLEQPQSTREQQRMTNAMDIFSAACVMMETFLNGERALDLGDLMEYRKKETSGTLQQKLNKIEFSAVRAACRHMLHLDPSERLSAKAYVERLEASELVPRAFEGLSEMMEKVTFASPDARLAIAVSYYGKLLWEAVGVRDIQGETYMQKVLGSAMPLHLKPDAVISGGGDVDPKDGSSAAGKSGSHAEVKNVDALPCKNADLFAETEELLRKLKNLNFDEDEMKAVASKEFLSTDGTGDEYSPTVREHRSEMSKSSLLIYLQLVVSTVRHVQRPSSKLVALQLMERLGKYSTDEARLQHIVPVTVSLLTDQDPLVRAFAIQVLSKTVNAIESFPPSDSKVFPEYIFKRASHLITDPALVVRLAFANSVAILAETSQRFLDVSQAVRLYEAVGGGGGRAAKGEETNDTDIKVYHTVFNEDVANLLDGSLDGKASEKRKLETNDSSGLDSLASDAASSGRSLINSTYATELAALHETVSRWVVHITTDRSEQSSPVKRALLSDIARLCDFFGLEGVMAFILPQLLSFLNERNDWQLREALFACLPSVCGIIGRAATEHFVLPCLETALVDAVESVVSRALQCLAHLVTMGLMTRSALLGNYPSNSSDSKPGLLNKYSSLLVHPSADIRFFAVATINAFCRSLGHPDAEVFVAPVLRSFLRFQPSFGHLTSQEGLRKCLKPPWTRRRFNDELESIQSARLLSPTAGHWTSVGLQVHDGSMNSPAEDRLDPEEDVDKQTQQVRLYLALLAKSRTHQMHMGKNDLSLRTHLNHCIEGSLKLSQQIKFPKQTVPGLPGTSIPPWYETLRDAVPLRDGVVESVAIRSVSAIGQIYGLSIMDHDAAKATSATESTVEQATKHLASEESTQIESASGGQWGSETCLDPTLSDTSLLVTKLNALRVPPLPPRLAEEKQPITKAGLPLKGGAREQPAVTSEWKLKIDTMVASSKSTPEHGHTAPIVRLVVSHDQRFFATGSHDSTCRIWELEKAERSNGILESSTVYTGHYNPKSDNPRVNDLAMVEGGHTVISGASDGSVHVWRVDLVSSSMLNQSDMRDVSRVVGSSEIRRTSRDEGEILAVNHFNTSSASILTYATQRGFLHSWDLRAASEPFSLKLPQDTGYITSMAMGSDRNWVVLGTNKGFISLWDLRFHQILKLWHHSRALPVNRLATSFVPAPQSWIGRGGATSESRPFIFAACGPNECAMFDLSTGACRECFRTVDYGSRFSKSRLDDMPSLQEMPLGLSTRRNMLLSRGVGSGLPDAVSSSFRSVNAMVGSIGASDQSFLITGGSDCRIRYWDFAMPSKCYVSAGPETVQPRPTFERIDYSQSSRLMLCRQPPTPTLREVDGSKIPRKVLQGAKRLEKMHDDAITDLKMFKGGLLSCSRDCTVKLWR